MKTLLWSAGLLVLLTACKRKEIAPNPTEINLTVVDEARKPIANMEVLILGRTGSYFGGTRKDTTFASQYTDVNGVMMYKAVIERQWRLYVRPSYYPNYNDIRFEGNPDGVVEVGRANKFIAILVKR